MPSVPAWDDHEPEDAGCCQMCAALGQYIPADYVTEDLDNLCERCTRETGAEIRYWF